MIKSKFKRVTSLFLATLMCVTTFAGIGSTTAYAASGEKADVYMVDFPRDGDANYDGVWGHSNLTLGGFTAEAPVATMSLSYS